MSALQNKNRLRRGAARETRQSQWRPLNGNRPRTDYGGFGEITDVCLKRKLRDRLLESGQAIFVQSDDRKVDSETSLRNARNPQSMAGKDAFKRTLTRMQPPSSPAPSGSTCVRLVRFCLCCWR